MRGKKIKGALAWCMVFVLVLGLCGCKENQENGDVTAARQTAESQAGQSAGKWETPTQEELMKLAKEINPKIDPNYDLVRLYGIIRETAQNIEVYGKKYELPCKISELPEGVKVEGALKVPKPAINTWVADIVDENGNKFGVVIFNYDPNNEGEGIVGGVDVLYFLKPVNFNGITIGSSKQDVINKFGESTKQYIYENYLTLNYKISHNVYAKFTFDENTLEVDSIMFTFNPQGDVEGE